MFCQRQGSTQIRVTDRTPLRLRGPIARQLAGVRKEVAFLFAACGQRRSLPLMWLSPNHQDSDFRSPLSLDDKITIFIDRTDGWQLSIAKQCGEIPHSAFAVLHILLSYFESIAKYEEGFGQDGRSEYHFKKGVQSVFPSIAGWPQAIRDAALKDLYSGGRCGMYHGGMTAPHIYISILPQNADMIYDPNSRTIGIYPAKLAESLITHLHVYERRLRDTANTTLRRNFETRFDFDSSHSQGVAWQPTP
jgi:hypothetical protein